MSGLSGSGRSLGRERGAGSVACGLLPSNPIAGISMLCRIISDRAALGAELWQRLVSREGIEVQGIG
jgi:hypothetical protein